MKHGKLPLALGRRFSLLVCLSILPLTARAYTVQPTTYNDHTATLYWQLRSDGSGWVNNGSVAAGSSTYWGNRSYTTYLEIRGCVGTWGGTAVATNRCDAPTTGALSWHYGSTPPPTIYTNAVCIRNPYIYPVTATVSGGNNPYIGQSVAFLGLGQRCFSWLTTNSVGSLEVTSLDADQPWVQTYTNTSNELPRSALDVSTAPPGGTVTPSNYVNFSGAAGAALDSTLKEGFNLLYSSGRENAAGLADAISDITVAPVVNVSVSNYTDMASMSAVSNMLRNSGDDGASQSNEMSFLWTDGPETKGNTMTADLRGEVIGLGSFFAFTPLPIPESADMLIEGTMGGIPYSINCDPASNAQLAGLLQWLRNFIKWAASVAWVWWAIKLVMREAEEMFKVQGFLGSTGVGKVLNAGASLLGFGYLRGLGTLTIFLGFFSALLLGVQSWLGYLVAEHSEIFANLSTGFMGSGVGDIALYLLNLVVPWNYLLYLIEAAVLFWLYVKAGALAFRMGCKLLVKV